MARMCLKKNILARKMVSMIKCGRHQGKIIFIDEFYI